MRKVPSRVRPAHPAIPEFYDCGETVDHTYIAMESIDAKDLYGMLQERKEFLPDKGVRCTICSLAVTLAMRFPSPITPPVFR